MDFESRLCRNESETPLTSDQLISQVMGNLYEARSAETESARTERVASAMGLIDELESKFGDPALKDLERRLQETVLGEKISEQEGSDSVNYFDLLS